MDTLQEQMIVAAAREIADGEVVFVGMRLPLLAFALAKATHAPNAVGLFECGLVRDEPARGPLVTMTDPLNVRGASWAGSLGELMGLMAQGHVTLGLVGAAQVDRFGNVNTSYIGGYAAPTARLPGSGGGSDILSLAQRVVVLLPHEPRRFVAEVDYLTSSGHGVGAGWREGVGLPQRPGPRSHGGPDAVITTLGTFRFDETGELELETTHAAVSIAQVQAGMGWPLKVRDDVTETLPITDEERASLQRLMRRDASSEG